MLIYMYVVYDVITLNAIMMSLLEIITIHNIIYIVTVINAIVIDNIITSNTIITVVSVTSSNINTTIMNAIVTTILCVYSIHRTA